MECYATLLNALCHDCVMCVALLFGVGADDDDYKSNNKKQQNHHHKKNYNNLRFSEFIRD